MVSDLFATSAYFEFHAITSGQRIALGWLLVSEARIPLHVMMSNRFPDCDSRNLSAAL